MPSVGAYRNGWIADFPDDINFLSIFECGSGNNNTNWCNKSYDDLLKKATAEPDQAKRYDLYQQAEAMLSGPNGDMPIAPIYWYTFAYQVADERHRLEHEPDGHDRPHQGRHRSDTASHGGPGPRPPAGSDALDKGTNRSNAEVRRPPRPLDDPDHPPRHLHDVLMMRAIKGSPFRKSERAVPPAVLANLNRKFGLDKPWYSQYFQYVKNVATLDLGPSLVLRNQDVNEIVKEHFPISAELGGLAMLLAIVVGIPLGILAALRANTVTDYLADALREPRLRRSVVPRRDALHLLLRGEVGGFPDERLGHAGARRCCPSSR